MSAILKLSGGLWVPQKIFPRETCVPNLMLLSKSEILLQLSARLFRAFDK